MSNVKVWAGPPPSGPVEEGPSCPLSSGALDGPHCGCVPPLCPPPHPAFPFSPLTVTLISCGMTCLLTLNYI